MDHSGRGLRLSQRWATEGGLPAPEGAARRDRTGHRLCPCAAGRDGRDSGRQGAGTLRDQMLHHHRRCRRLPPPACRLSSALLELSPHPLLLHACRLRSAHLTPTVLTAGGCCLGWSALQWPVPHSGCDAPPGAWRVLAAASCCCCGHSACSAVEGAAVQGVELARNSTHSAHCATIAVAAHSYVHAGAGRR